MTAAEALFNRLKSLRANAPLDEFIPSSFIEEYHSIIDQLEKITQKELLDYRIPPKHIQRKYLGGVNSKAFYSEDVFCRRPYMLSKMDALITTPPHHEDKDAEPLGPLETVELICKRFTQIVNELKDRGRDRKPLLMDDEYDVQYLMGALLRLHFEDIRAEEWAPSYAGGASRMDFLLKTEEVVIETKMAREKMDANQLGKELLVDIAKYKEHKDCKTLVCFVFDPAGRVKNAPGVKADLERNSGKIKVKVFIER